MNYDVIADEYDSRYYLDDNSDNMQIRTYLNKLCIKYSIKSALEIGCGSGYWLEALRKNNLTNIKGIDISEKMILKARNRCKKFHNINICKSDFLYNYNDDIKYNLIISNFFWSAALENDSINLGFIKVYDLLINNGIYFFVDNKIPEAISKSGINNYLLTLKENWGGNDVYCKYYLYEQKIIEDKLKKTGFKIIKSVDISEDIYLVIAVK